MKQELTVPTFDEFMSKHMDEINELIDDPTWPKDYCFDTCATIVDDLRAQFKGRWSMRFGHFDDQGHTWLRDGVSRVIVDPTLGQFVDGPAWRVVVPSDSLYGKYSNGGMGKAH